MIRTRASVRNPISAGAVAEADAVEMTVSHVNGGKAGAPEPVAIATEAKAEKAKNAARRERLLGMLDGIEQTGVAYKARLAALHRAHAALRKNEGAGGAKYHNIACVA